MKNNNRKIRQKESKYNSDTKDQSRFVINEIRVTLVIILFSVIVVVRSLQMPIPRGWNSAPGLFPFFIGVSLIIVSIIVIYDTLKENKQINLKEDIININLGTSIKNNFRIIIVIFFVLLYYFVLINVVPFEIATAIYIFLSLSYFWKEGKLRYKIIISILIPIFLLIVFKDLFKIILPGISILDLL